MDISHGSAYRLVELADTGRAVRQQHSSFRYGAQR
jgi:hypothetical protein